MTKKILEVKELSKHFNIGKKQTLYAVDKVSFDIYENESFGIVGESGCGKTTLDRTILGLYENTSGQVLFDGMNIHIANKKTFSTSKKELR